MSKTVLVFLAGISIAFGLNAPSGFQPLGNKYIVSEAIATFFEALVECHIYGYKLASVSNQEEEQQLENLTTTSSGYWLGGVYYKETAIFFGKWVWIENEEEVSYTNWGNNEPNFESGVNCIALSLGHWYSYGCQTRSFRFICEI